jgi:hypothetical protein
LARRSPTRAAPRAANDRRLEVGDEAARRASAELVKGVACADVLLLACERPRSDDRRLITCGAG